MSIRTVMGALILLSAAAAQPALAEDTAGSSARPYALPQQQPLFGGAIAGQAGSSYGGAALSARPGPRRGGGPCGAGEGRRQGGKPPGGGGAGGAGGRPPPLR